MTNFTRDTPNKEYQPVAIVRLDPTTRTAWGKTGYGSIIQIDCRYAVGEIWVMPVVGEQWFVERFNLAWRLCSRIPFNDSSLNIEAEAGQVLVGSPSGPLVLVGSTVKIPEEFYIGNTKYRDNNGSLERKNSSDSWVPVGSINQPIPFSTPVAMLGVTATNKCYAGRTLTGAYMRVASAPGGSALIAEVQHYHGSGWIGLGTLTIADGSLVEASVEFNQDQVAGDLLRINVTSVGSSTPATGLVVDVIVE